MNHKRRFWSKTTNYRVLKNRLVKQQLHRSWLAVKCSNWTSGDHAVAAQLTHLLSIEEHDGLDNPTYHLVPWAGVFMPEIGEIL